MVSHPKRKWTVMIVVGFLLLGLGVYVYSQIPRIPGGISEPAVVIANSDNGDATQLFCTLSVRYRINDIFVELKSEKETGLLCTSTIGSKVRVSYDPKSPGHAVLIAPEDDGVVYVSAALGAFFVIFGLYRRLST